MSPSGSVAPSLVSELLQACALEVRALLSLNCAQIRVPVTFISPVLLADLTNSEFVHHGALLVRHKSTSGTIIIMLPVCCCSCVVPKTLKALKTPLDYPANTLSVAAPPRA